MECAGQGDAMHISVYDDDGVVAEEMVGSAEEGWRRGTAICRELAAGGAAVWERHSG